MATRYQIRLKDTAGSVVAIFDDFRSLRFGHKVNAPGYFALQINAEDSRAALFTLDSQVEIYRSDPANSLDWYIEKEALTRTNVTQVFENGIQTLTAYGRGYLDLLARRAIAWKAGRAESKKSAPAETAIKEFVDENAGLGALAASGRELDGVITGLTVQADAAGGATWDGSRAWRNLITVLQGIGLDTDYTFDVIGTGAALFEFRTFADQRGTDRSNAGLDPSTGLNGAGNAPVIFSVDTGSIRNASFSENREKEANAAIILGPGEREDRNVRVTSDAAAIADSPWNQTEVTRNASNQDEDDELDAVGDTVIADLAAIETLSFDPLQLPALLYGKDYNFGDKVTVNFLGTEIDKEIVGVDVVVGAAARGEQIRFTFKDAPR